MRSTPKITYCCVVAVLCLVAVLLACGGGNGTGRTVTEPPVQKPISKYLYAANVSSHNISGFSVNATSGALATLGTVAATGQPRYVATTPDGKFLYAGNQDTNKVNAYSINADTGVVTELSGSPYTTAGMQLFAMGIDPSGKFLYTCNQGGGITAFGIGTDGKLTLINTYTATYNVATGISVHASGKWLYVSTQGPNGVTQWTIGTNGALSSPVSTTVGVNNDGIAIDPAGKFLYVATGGTNSVYGYKIDATTGALTPTTPASFDIGGVSEGIITIEPSGKYLYVDSWDAHKIYSFAIGTNGALTATPGTFLSLGTAYPSGIAAEKSGTYLYVAGGDAGYIIGAKINQSTGDLTLMGPVSTFTAGTMPAGIAVAR